MVHGPQSTVDGVTRPIFYMNDRSLSMVDRTTEAIVIGLPDSGIRSSMPQRRQRLVVTGTSIMSAICESLL